MLLIDIRVRVRGRGRVRVCRAYSKAGGEG